MTQRERVLKMLTEAGPRGVRSDTFIANFMPRAAARVQELKEDGHEISSEREGKYCRWTLTNVGVDAGCLSHAAGETQSASIHSGVECLDSSPSGGAPPESLFDLPAAPSAFDPWERAA